MAEKKKWIQAASKKMEEKGTKGSLKKIAKKAGELDKKGKIKKEFLNKEIKSKNPSIRKKANFAKNVSK
jgi:hypothetical protein